MGPVPVPDPPKSMVIHVADFLSSVVVHGQSVGVAVTVKDPVSPAAVKRSEEVELRVKAQGTPVWVIVKVFPPMVIVPVLTAE